MTETTAVLIAGTFLAFALLTYAGSEYQEILKLIVETNNHISGYFRRMRFVALAMFLSGAILSAIICYFVYVWYTQG